jgi:2-amino-4-hydroxy-6-hydroxymethyldihydropteridine diphosphokinase
MGITTYAVALGSNRRTRFGSPERTLLAALEVLGGVVARSRVIATPPLGPGGRRFANAAALVRTAEAPPALLARCKAIERAFGRRAGQRWGARALDLDLVLWSGGAWEEPGLVIPHPAFRARAFVLRPLAEVAGDWRDPISGRRVRALLHAVDRRRPRP